MVYGSWNQLPQLPDQQILIKLLANLISIEYISKNMQPKTRLRSYNWNKKKSKKRFTETWWFGKPLIAKHSWNCNKLYYENEKRLHTISCNEEEACKFHQAPSGTSYKLIFSKLPRGHCFYEVVRHKID